MTIIHQRANSFQGDLGLYKHYLWHDSLSASIISIRVPIDDQHYFHDNYIFDNQSCITLLRCFRLFFSLRCLFYTLYHFSTSWASLFLLGNFASFLQFKCIFHDRPMFILLWGRTYKRLNSNFKKIWIISFHYSFETYVIESVKQITWCYF